MTEEGLIAAKESEGKQEESKYEESNPFRLPSDEQVFSMREQEKRSWQEAREKLKKMSVWEKTQASMKRRGIVSRRELDAELGMDLVIKDRNVSKRNPSGSGVMVERRREKSSMADFISKKREMFLVQMSLDTKREEIRKLENEARMKEEALRKSEQMLEEDALRFDSFLKENDKKAHEAIKKAEAETKLKQEKVQEIKKLNHQIQAVQSDMSKLKEQLEDCLQYKAFLDELTPQEWIEKQKRKIHCRNMRRRRVFKTQKLRKYEEAKAAALEKFEEDKRREEAKHNGKPRHLRREQVANNVHLQLPDPPVFDFSDDEEEEEEEEKEKKECKLADIDDGEEDELEEEFETIEELKAREEEDSELPMYFIDPAQLLSIFSQLEESNLFLIQNSQETESALEELKQEHSDTKDRMDSKTDSLKGNINELESQIHHEEAKVQLLQSRMESSFGEDAQEELLTELNEKVKEVYQRCGFDYDANPSTLSMLTDLEAKLEDLLAKIAKLPEDYVLRAEKLKEKERRERVRAERMAQQQRLYEERLRKSIERSMQAPKKKTGKPIMFRSSPPQKKEKKKDDSQAEQKAREIEEFFSW